MQGGEVEVVEGVLPPPALHLDQAEAVEGFGVFGVEVEGGAKVLFGVVEPAGAELGGAELEPAFECPGAQEGVAFEFIDGGGQVFLLEVQAAEVVAHDDEFVIQGEGGAVGVGGGLELVVAVVGEAKVVPGVGVLGEEGGSFFELGDGLCVLSGVEELFAVEELSRSGGCATGVAVAGRRHQQTIDRFQTAISIGQHRGWW